MLFSSMTFIFIFLPILCLIYFLSKKEYHNTVLLIASIIFYAWSDVRCLAILFVLVVINWLLAICIEKQHNKWLRNSTLILTILLNIGNLCYFKYTNFIITNYNNLLNGKIELLNIIVPLGISFYTFQALSYILDVYRKDCKAQKNIYDFALYICLFPQLVAGPIIKYHDIENQIENREVNFDNVNYGVKRFIIGLAKKVLIADALGEIADKIFLQYPASIYPHEALIGAVTYTLQIYYDFSAYSDMAIGLGLIFGFKFMENFNYPYISTSITEFWRRWHISLSSWFKHYIYIPLGGSQKGKIRLVINLLIVFLITGIWHGAAWKFVAWGLWNALFIIMEKITGLCNKSTNIVVNIAKHIYTILVIMLGWVIFRHDNLPYAITYIKNIFGATQMNWRNHFYDTAYYIHGYEILIISIAIICCMPIFKDILKVQNKFAKVFINIWFILLFVVSTAAIAANTYKPFIYFQF